MESTVFGPVWGKRSDVPYQGLTTFDKAVEEALLDCDYRDLILFLRTKTEIVGTDTHYSAVQCIAGAFTQAEVLKWLGALSTRPKRKNPVRVESGPRIVPSNPDKVVKVTVKP